MRKTLESISYWVRQLEKQTTSYGITMIENEIYSLINPLNQIMGVKEASELWGLSPDHIKKLCREGKVISRNIGKTWIINKNQQNPKKAAE